MRVLETVKRDNNNEKQVKLHYLGRYKTASFSFKFEEQHNNKEFLSPVQSACQGYDDIETNPYATLRLLALLFEPPAQDNNTNNIQDFRVKLVDIIQGPDLVYVNLALTWASPPMIREMTVYHRIPCVRILAA